jgi:LysR family transcriptional regulator, glycine cleavage system transcriptional activator
MSKSSRRLPPLHGLRAFEAAARHLSFKDAAEELAVSPTAVSHHIRQLESTLGAKLFERRSRQVELTPAAKELYPVLRDGFDSFAQAIAGLRTRKSRAVVTLSATVAFTARWLVPRAPVFHRANPRMDLRLHASDDLVDLHAGTADAAIRYGLGKHVGGLEAEELFRDTFAPVCAPSLRLRRVTDLSEHTLIHSEWRRPRRQNPIWPRWLERAGSSKLRPKSHLYLTDENQVIQAAIAGLGVALVSLPLVGEEFERGTLMQPFGPVLDGFRYDLVYPEAAQSSEKIEALRAWIRGEMHARAIANAK